MKLCTVTFPAIKEKIRERELVITDYDSHRRKLKNEKAVSDASRYYLVPVDLFAFLCKK